MSNIITKEEAQILKDLTTPEYPRQNYVNLAQGMSKATSAGAVSAGQFFLSNEDAMYSLPLGEFTRRSGELQGALTLKYIGWRAKAMILLDSTNVVAMSHNALGSVFQQIKNTKPIAKGEGPQTITPMYGTEIFFYVPPTQIVWPDQNPRVAWDPNKLVEEKERLKDGFLATFFFTKKNLANSIAGKPNPGEWVTLYSLLQKVGNNMVWQTPSFARVNDTSTLENDSVIRMIEDAMPAFEASKTYEMIRNAEPSTALNNR